MKYKSKYNVYVDYHGTVVQVSKDEIVGIKFISSEFNQVFIDVYQDDLYEACTVDLELFNFVFKLI